ncbi:MAG: histidine kinase [Dysgonomonas sp.]|nr:histidine kinase [Dysgonomonas sp.]
MKEDINNHVIADILINPKFRIYRHIILLSCVFIMSISAFWDAADGMIISTNRIYGWIGYLFAFCTILYVNLFFLTPRFLLKNKPFKYILSAILSVIFLITVIDLARNLPGNSTIEETIKPMPYLMLLSIGSSTFSIILVLAGSSTMLLLRNWIIHTQRIGELESTTLQSELQFLKSQINPHFLFNMLNNANIMVEEDPDTASKILLKLDDMLSYQLKDSAKDKVYLKDDIDFLIDFLDLEKTRRDHFEFRINKKGNIDNIEIPPLLFITFIENAVKHSPDSNNLSYVNIDFIIENGKLIFDCVNSKPRNPTKRETGGLGLVNIRRRLDLLYGNNYKLELRDTETKYTVHLELKIS